MVGNIFLRATFPTLQTMKTEAAVNKRQQPYMYDFFNIRCYFQQSDGSADGTLHKIYNALVEALNQKAHLPRYLMVIPDRDLILQADHYNQGLNHILDKDILWLTKQIERAFTCRREDLKSKNLGGSGTRTHHHLDQNDTQTSHKESSHFPCL